MGFLLEETGRTAEAEEAYRRAVDRDSRSAAVNLGHMLEQRNDRAGAIEAYTAAVRLGDVQSMRRLAALGHTVMHTPDGVTVYPGRRRGAWPSRSPVTPMRPGTHRRGVRADPAGNGRAEPRWRGREPGHGEPRPVGDSEAAPKAAFNLGAALTMQGRLDEAVEALRLAIDSGHPEFAPQALALLAELDGQQPSTPTPRPPPVAEPTREGPPTGIKRGPGHTRGGRVMPLWRRKRGSGTKATPWPTGQMLAEGWNGLRWGASLPEFKARFPQGQRRPLSALGVPGWRRSRSAASR